jgi:predicted metalloendopeptidase
MDDYLQMEAWYGRKAWTKDLFHPPNKYQWFLNAFDIDTYYSRQQNRVVVPAATMVAPMFDIHLPSYVNYGALGTIMATELMHGFDSVGHNFSLNGTLESQLAEGDQKEYDERAQCFLDKYEGMRVKGNGRKWYPLNANIRLDSIIADTHGVDLAYYAWKSAKRKDQLLPGFSQYTDDQMFFLIRSMFSCSKERSQVLRNELGTGTELPKRVRSWAPLEDSWAWQAAFSCKPKDKVCRMYGEDENPGKYTKLKASDLGPNGTANATANATEPWNPEKYYYIPDEDEDDDGE